MNCFTSVVLSKTNTLLHFDFESTSELGTLGYGLSQINQGDKNIQYVVLDWGGGTNTSDAGCAYALFPVDDEKMKPTGILSLPKELHRVVVENDVFKLGTGDREEQLYDLSGRRVHPSRLPRKVSSSSAHPMEKRWCSKFAVWLVLLFKRNIRN